MSALKLSYHHLPLELRQCFAYFAAFPKDYRIIKEELILLWMAHGIISSRGTLATEDVGNELCDELLLRSLLQLDLYYDKIGMHDLVQDLAQSIMENKVLGIKSEQSILRVSTIRQVNLLHRFVFFPKTFQQDLNISSSMELTRLRILDANRTGIKELPPSIGNLKHLRYLNLSYSQIRTLPNSLCSLWNLQILNLDYCKRLVALPNNMRYLRNLLHLLLTHCKSLSEMPSKMRELTRLKTLSMFVVGFNRSNKLEELQRLNLCRRLEIGHLERVKDHMDAEKANLADKRSLRELSLSWERNRISKLGEHFHEKVLEALEPPSNLEQLRIEGFGGRYFPLWMTNSVLGKVVRIEIVDCENCRRLPKLGGLPHLTALHLENVGVDYIVEDEEDGNRNQVMVEFQALLQLYLSDLPYLRGLSKNQESKEAFPNLKHLLILGCSLLKLRPLSSFETLEHLHCNSSILALFSQPDTLTLLRVTVEEKTATFPMEMLVRFANLHDLTIVGANEISVPVQGLKTL